MYGAGAASFCLEPEPTQVGRSRLQDLGHQEPEPPKKVAAPQHCIKRYYKVSQHKILHMKKQILLYIRQVLPLPELLAVPGSGER